MFRKDIGTSLNDYINSLRVEKAKHLLENTNTKVIDIALEVGFDTLPYFSSVFKNIREFHRQSFGKENRYLKNESFCTFCVRTFVFFAL